MTATLMLDRKDLVAPPGPTTSSPLLEQVRDLLEDVRERLAAESAILVDRDRAAMLLNMSASWISQNTAPKGRGIPAVRCGANVRYRVDALKAWCAQQEQAEQAAAAGRAQ